MNRAPQIVQDFDQPDIVLDGRGVLEPRKNTAVRPVSRAVSMSLAQRPFMIRSGYCSNSGSTFQSSEPFRGNSHDMRW